MSNQDNESNNDSKKKSAAPITIAAKDASERISGGRPDPGPGDMSAAPSSLPEPVETPAPPTASELVVKSGGASDAADEAGNELQPEGEEPTPDAATGATSEGGPPTASSQSRSKSKSKSEVSAEATSNARTILPPSAKTLKTKSKSGVKEFPPSQTPPSSAAASDSLAPSTSPEAGPSGTGSMSGKSGSGVAGSKPSSKKSVSHGSKLSHTDSKPMTSPTTSGKKSSKTGKHSEDTNSDLMKSMSPGGGHLTASTVVGKDGKKVTKFRYHKRITVRTKGHTKPEAVMAKVNKKDHKAGITISTLDNLNSAEVMKRAGLKPNEKGHWRLRLRQTKKVTKNGKTHIETKVAYRDSKGNKNIKTSHDPYCLKCGKQADECNCHKNSSK